MDPTYGQMPIPNFNLNLYLKPNFSTIAGRIFAKTTVITSLFPINSPKSNFITKTI